MELKGDIFDLSGKTAVVTGGSGLLGTEICKSLALYGANVAVVDINGDAASNLAATLNKLYSSKSIGICCDVTCKTSVDNMVKHVVDEFGEINILHNNAASKSEDINAFFASFESYSIEQWKSVMSVNIDGMFLVAQAVGKQMLTQKMGGSIIQTSSIYGVFAPDQRIYLDSDYDGHTINTPAVYSASKAAVIGLSKYLASYWGNKGIRVNSISPGGIESGQNEIFQSNYSARVPMERMGKVSEVVGALLFLASDASSYITGQNIIIDGGLDCW